MVRGDKQEHLVDYFECFAPVARHTTLGSLLAIAAAKGLGIQQLDNEIAFLNGDVDETIYVEQPRGYKRGQRGMVCELMKALYGLKQAARQWHIKRAGVLKSAGFERCASDPCLFKGERCGMTVCIFVYVDDLLVVAETAAAANAATSSVAGVLNAREMGEPSYFLVLHFDQDHKAGTITLG